MISLPSTFREVGRPAVSYTLSGEGIFVKDVDLHDAIAHSIEELGVVGTLLRNNYVVRRCRTPELDALVCKPERRERWDSAGGISEVNGHGNQYTVHMMTS